MCPASQCRIRKSPTSLLGSPRTAARISSSLNSSQKTSRSRSPTMSNETIVTRRGLLTKLALLFNGVIAVALAVPIVQFLLSAITRGRGNAYLSWVPLGAVSDFPEGQTRLATFRNPYVTPTDGKTADTACWVRHTGGDQFQVFAINCMHLGCPVRGFPNLGFFRCPCPGGGYSRDVSGAAAPRERGLVEYPWKVEKGQIIIQAGELPTPGGMAALDKRSPPCA